MTDMNQDEAKKYEGWLTQKKLRFSTPKILNIFSQKIQELILGLVGKIDVKDSNVAQPIWLSGCQM